MSGPSASGKRGLARLAALFSLRTISGKLIIGSGSPYPIAAEANVGQPSLDTFADRYARATRFADQPGAPSSARADVEKWAIDPSSIS